MSEAIFGATLPRVFVAALAFNYHGFIPLTDTCQQKDKLNGRSELKQKIRAEGQIGEDRKGTHQRGHQRKKTSLCIKNCRTTGNFVNSTRGPEVNSRMTERNPQALGPGEPAGRLTRPVDQRTIYSAKAGGGERGETMMRLPIISLLVIAGAWLGQTQVSDAQSAYSYPWCSLGGTRSSNALSCYFTSWEQCRTTMSGIGGNCVESPYYHAAPTQPLHRSVVKPHHHRHARTVQMSTHERLE